jgi:hypothetical protein
VVCLEEDAPRPMCFFPIHAPSYAQGRLAGMILAQVFCPEHARP